MAILIGYASKYGMTREYAEAMAKALGPGAQVMDLGSGKAGSVDLGSFKKIILGSSVYAGSARSAFRRFLERRSVELGGKDLSFFLCGLAKGDDAKDLIEKTVPADLRPGEAKMAYLPGWVDNAKLNFFERFIMNMIAKSEAKNGKPSELPSKPDAAREAAAYLKRAGAL